MTSDNKRHGFSHPIPETDLPEGYHYPDPRPVSYPAPDDDSIERSGMRYPDAPADGDSDK